jgi:thiol-disulfide isomerase/thioredoxin
MLVAGTLVVTATLLRKPRAIHADEADADATDDLATLQPFSPAHPLAAFGFSDADGHALTLADYKGRGVVLNFWASWCHPCVEELPSLDALARTVQDAGIVVLAVSSDHGGAATVRSFYDSHGIRALPVLLDDGMRAGHALGLRGIPTTLLIDVAGREVARFEGGANWSSAASVAKIKRLIAPEQAGQR